MNRQGFEPRGHLPTTHWSTFDLILTDSQDGPAALEQFAARYRPAIYAHLLARLHGDRETAEDFTQEFMVRTRFLKILIAKAKPNQGPFRNYLLTAIRNFVADRFKEAGSQKRGGDLQRADLTELTEAPAAPTEPVEAFNLEWSRIVMHQALTRMRETCEREQRLDIWEVFVERLVRPILQDEPPTKYEEFVRRCGFESPLQAANVLTTGKKKYVACLKAVIAEYEQNGDRAVHAELEDLKVLLGRLQSRGKKSSRAHTESRRRSRKLVGNSSANACEGTQPNEPRQLAELLNLAMNRDGSRIWAAEELRAVLAHQLAAPMQFELTGLPAEGSANLKLLSEREGLLLKSYGELLRHRCPPVELLRLVKDFAKSHLEHASRLLPQEVAKTLYYLSIAVALVRCGQRISRLGDTKLQAGFDWILAQPWIDAATKAVVDQARNSLSEAQRP